MPDPNRFTNLQQADQAARMREAAAYKPVLKEDIVKAYEPYGEQFGSFITRQTTDTTLYQRAVDKVIAWYRKTKADEAARAAAEAKRAAQEEAAAAAQKQAQDQAAATAQQQATSTASRATATSGTKLPNTAMSTKVSPPAPVPLGVSVVSSVLGKYNVRNVPNLPLFYSVTALENWLIQHGYRKSATTMQQARQIQRTRIV